MNDNFLDKLPQQTRDQIIESLLVSISDRAYNFTINPVLIRECIDTLEKENYIVCTSPINRYDFDKIRLTEIGKSKLDAIYPKYLQIIPMSNPKFYKDIS